MSIFPCYVYLSLLRRIYAELQNLKHCGFLQFGINECVRVRVVSSKSEISRTIFKVTLQSGERLSSFNKDNRDNRKGEIRLNASLQGAHSRPRPRIYRPFFYLSVG